MKSLFLFSFLTFSVSSLAQVSPTPGLMSKLKIQAVLAAVTGTDEIIKTIEVADNNYVVVTIEQGECMKKELFKVKATAGVGRAPKMSAVFVDLEDTNCR